MEFRADFTARFSDADPAGIVYFARFFDFCHRALEAYFSERLMTPYAEFIQREGLGVPIVHVEGDFSTPVRFGETFAVSVRPLSVGKSSLKIAYAVHKPEQSAPCATFQITHVVTELRQMRPAPIPEAIRRLLLADLTSLADGPGAR
jgi:4-hydroxybenzoyl-CoA thioesterase